MVILRSVLLWIKYAEGLVSWVMAFVVPAPTQKQKCAHGKQPPDNVST